VSLASRWRLADSSVDRATVSCCHSESRDASDICVSSSTLAPSPCTSSRNLLLRRSSSVVGDRSRRCGGEAGAVGGWLFCVLSAVPSEVVGGCLSSSLFRGSDSTVVSIDRSSGGGARASCVPVDITLLCGSLRVATWLRMPAVGPVDSRICAPEGVGW
jgi:hypothetical protein